MSAPKISVSEFDEIIREDLPWAHEIGMRTDAITHGAATLRLPFHAGSLRPGGVVSGPSIMALADACMYAVVLSAIGSVKLAVTTSFNINFLYGARPVDLLADGSMLRLGKRLAVIEVRLHSEGHAQPVAYATGTYSIPPPKTS